MFGRQNVFDPYRCPTSIVRVLDQLRGPRGRFSRESQPLRTGWEIIIRIVYSLRVLSLRLTTWLISRRPRLHRPPLGLSRRPSRYPVASVLGLGDPVAAETSVSGDRRHDSFGRLEVPSDFSECVVCEPALARSLGALKSEPRLRFCLLRSGRSRGSNRNQRPVD